MKSKRRLWSLSGSLLLHGLALAGAVALVSREPSRSILIVELEEAIRVGEQPGLPPAAPRGDPRSPVGPRGPWRPLRPSAPVVGRPVVPEPPLPADPSRPVGHPRPEPRPEPGAAPSASASVVLPPPAGAPVAERVLEVPRPASGFQAGGGGGGAESTTGGTPGGGPLAMLAPGGRSGGEGAGGGGAGVPAEFGPYLAAFRQRIQEALEYPLAARRRGLGGTVHLEVEILPTGKVASVVVRDSSSHAILDQAALDTVSRLQPVPFPPGAAPRPLKVRLPIVFELK